MGTEDDKEYVILKSWKEFRDSGFLWWINMVLHTFGWAIIVDVDKDGRVLGGHPARVKFRGFPDERNTKGYIQVSEYMKENAEVLLNESKDE